MPASPFIRGFTTELTKVGARAGLKLIRKLVGEGEIGKANRLARMGGVLKDTEVGSQIRHLGTGAEGTATLVGSPKGGLEVRKVYDPKGISGPKMIARKAEVGRQLADSPDVAQFHGEVPTRIGPAHKYEYVPGEPVEKAIARGTPGAAEATTKQTERVKAEAKKRGFEMADLHPGNTVITPRRPGQAQGKTKIVDYLPTKPDEPLGFNSIPAEGKRREEFDAYLEDPRRQGNLMARAFRGAPPLVPGSRPGYEHLRKGTVQDLPETAKAKGLNR